MKENNIFAPVVVDIDTTVSPEAKTVLMLHILVVVVPFTENDIVEGGLNS